MSSRNATPADFKYVIKSMANKMIDPLKSVTHRVKFNEVGQEFSGLLDPAKGVVKAMISISRHLQIRETVKQEHQPY